MNEALVSLSKRIKHYIGVLALLQWDEEINLPAKGLDERAQQKSLIATLLHTELTGAQAEDVLAAFNCSDDNPTGKAAPGSDDAALLRELYREYRQAKRIPVSFVEKETMGISQAFRSWRQARAENNGAVFLPQLSHVIELMKEKAEYLGYSEDVYDALLDIYEPGMKSSEVDVLFEKLVPELRSIRNACLDAEQPQFPHESYHIPNDAQFALGKALVDALGYPADRGRLDISAHPFSTTLGSNDVRITTRYDVLLSCVFSCAHEFGHALYELQIDPKWHETMLSDGTSLTIHESQSRTWENIICRSRSFWEFWYPRLIEFVPEYKDVPLELLWKRINRVGTEFIRIESDEVSYNLHIVLRYFLERKLIKGDLSVQELPDAWREMAQTLLNHRPSDDNNGFLQDIHWSHGSFGYFSTYALGNLTAAQFFAEMKKDLPNYETNLTKGDFEPIRNWQKTRIHTHGKARSAKEITQDVTGSSLQVDAFLRYIRDKYAELYRIQL